MSEVKIVYGDLDDTITQAKNVAKKCDDYVDELKKDFTDKWSQIPASPVNNKIDRIGNASYYVEAKRTALGKKAQSYRDFAEDVKNFKDFAEQADKNVVKYINNSRESFLNDHTNLKGDGWSAFFANLVVDVPVLGWIAEGISNIVSGFHDMRVNLRYWYEVGGGKKIVDTALAVTGLVLAAVGLVIAAVGLTLTGPIWGIIVSVCALVGAVIAVINAVTNLATQIKANKQSDPAWAQYYGGIDTLSQQLRKKTFKSKFMNKYSGAMATALDTIETVCAVVAIADGIKKLYSSSGLKKLFGESQAGKYKNVLNKNTNVMEKVSINGKGAHEYKFSFEKFKKCVTTKDGWKSIGSTLKSNFKNMFFGYNTKADKGFEVYKKQYTRAFNKDGFAKKTKAVAGLFKRDFGRVNSVFKTTESLGKIAMYGFSVDRVNSLLKNGYAVSQGGGMIKSGNEIADKIKNVPKLVETENDYKQKIVNGLKPTA